MRLVNINWILYSLLALTAVKGIIWAGIIPAWQAPDEQNHFSLIQFYAESKKLAVDPKYDNTVSEELLQTTDLMNVDWSGKHPMWRPEFSNTSVGLYEEKISQIAKEDCQTFLFMGNGRKSPPFYYLLGGIVYLIFSPFDILVRLFALRFLSVAIGVGTVFFTYLFVKEIYPARQWLALASATLVSFQSSFNFVTSTVNVDSMVIFLTTVFVYVGIKYLKAKDEKLKDIFWLMIVSVLGVLIKATLLPLVVVLFITIGARKIKEQKITRQNIEIAILFISLITLYLISSVSFGFLTDIASFFAQARGVVFFTSLLNFAKSAIPHYNGQVFGWYWAVFGWLEVSLPVNFYRVLKILTVFAFFGLGVVTYRKLRTRNFNNLGVILFIFGTLLFLHGATFFFDWQTFVRTGNLFGFQGRHFLSPIGIHMFLLTIGLTVFFKSYQQKLTLFLLIVLFIFLNIFSIYQISHYFYPSKNLLELYFFVSQYKPVFLKAPFLLAYSFIFIILLGLFLYQIFVNFLGNWENK